VLDLWTNGIDHWVPGDQQMAGEDGYLGGFFVLSVWPEGADQTYPPRVGAELEAIRALYRGRMLVWTAVENGLATDLYFAEGIEQLTLAAEAFPDNRIPRMYLGEPIPNPVADDPDAPSWASDQRVALTALSDQAAWWIAHRQAPDGQFGGGWGDDVEMWRNWTPILLSFEDPELVAAWELLADNLWELPRMEDGYSDVFTDVEHSAEDSGDTVTSMLRIRPDDPIWAARADLLLTLFETVWTAENDRGMRQFQSTWFDGTRVDDDPSHACDTTYHARAVQPALLRFEDPTSPLADWLRTWTDAAARDERGKASGILPSSMHWPSGDVGGPDEDWWDPGCHFNPAPYAYPRFAGPMVSSLLLAAEVSGDPVFVETVDAMVTLREDWRAKPLGDDVIGSEAWAAAEMNFLADGLASHRARTGDRRWDTTIAADGDAWQRLAVGGDRADVEAALSASAEAFRWDWPAYTSEVRFTDRVLKLHSKFINETADRPTPKTSILYQTTSGDAADSSYGPVPAVRWRTHPRDIAALVTVASPTTLIAELYNFEATDRDMGAHLYRIRNGNWSLSCDGEVLLGSVVDSESAFTLPPGQLCVLEVAAS